MQESEVRALIKKMMRENYVSGVPEIPPHSHDGVDNLQVDPADLLGFPILQVSDATVEPTDTPITGTLRFQYDGTDFTEWIMNGTEWVELTGGGAPGAPDTSVQVNVGGVFTGSDFFKYVDADQELFVGDPANGTGGIQTSYVKGFNPDGFPIAFGLTTADYVSDPPVNNSGVSINFANTIVSTSPVFNDNGSDVVIYAGNATPTTGDYGGHVFIFGGAGPDSFPDNIPGSIILTTPSTVTATNGDVLIGTGQTSSTELGSVIVGGMGSRVQIGGAVSLLSGTDHTNTLTIVEGTVPSSSATSAGILYVESGALKYRGAGGTVTTVAPS